MNKLTKDFTTTKDTSYAALKSNGKGHLCNKIEKKSDLTMQDEKKIPFTNRTAPHPPKKK